MDEFRRFSRKALPLLTLAVLSSACRETKTKQPPPQQKNTITPVRSVTRTSSSVTVLSDVQTIDRIYPSMTGPFWTKKILLTDSAEPELLWIHSVQSLIKGADGITAESDQYMCHSNLDWERAPVMFHRSRKTPRMFTLSQGQLDLKLPRGFGVPIISSEPLRLATQILNLHQKTGVKRVRHETKIEFSRDQDQKTPITPLTYRTLAVKVSMTGESAVLHKVQPTPLQRQARCLPGEDAGQGNVLERDIHGRQFSGHWMVPPGRHVYRTLATPQLDLHADTRVHAVASHLHPYAESLALRDLNTGKTIFEAFTKNYANSVGLKHVDSYSDATGFAVEAGHEYEVVVTYNNTTQEKQDAMAVLYLYLEDTEFQKPSSEQVQKSIAAQPSSQPSSRPAP